MRFGEQYAYHKIPEWYIYYLDYDKLKTKIEQFKADKAPKLHGYYYLTQKCKVIKMDHEINEEESEKMSCLELEAK